MKQRLMHTALALGWATLSLIAAAGPVHGVIETKPTGQSATSSHTYSPKKLGLNEGIVEEVDNENQSIVIHHGRIKSKTVEMGPMTMPFNVAKASLLKAVKVGDRVKFNVENVNDMPTLTSLKVQR
jgi:Cu(I)/Ag(I) efflux system periplasmic protein CusF